ncbi:MAG: argininosuccinate lyase [Clostridia bacterium]|nr:argininosuccinate lyase [Clostridia bacterium]
MAKMWAGRFTKEENTLVNDFNSSISFDKRLFEEDIKGSCAHVTMLGETNILPKEDVEKILTGLESILGDLKSGKLEINLEAEDIHMFVEEELTKRIGDAGKKLHTARSRNDQVALDMNLYVKKESSIIIDLLKDFITCLVDIADNNLNTIMPGFTHLQKAQPVTLAHYMCAYANMFLRDISKLKLLNSNLKMPLGSCALAGTTYPIDRNMVAKQLGFENIYNNSLDGVSDRDYVIEFASCISISMMHLSRLAEEIIIWTSNEYSYIELDDAYSTGSSIMPQKKNPDIAELVRGKTGRTFGNLMSLLTIMKGLPLAYNKDMQEDKEAIFDSVDTIKKCIPLFGDMLKTTKFNIEKLKKSAEFGYINATDVADYLTKKGVPFRDAYKISGKLVAICIEKKITLNELELEEYKKMSNLFEKDIYNAIDLTNCVEKRTSIGGPSNSSVKVQIKKIKQELNN